MAKITRMLTLQEVASLPFRKCKLSKAYRYAKLMEQGVEFPPVYVFYNEKHQLDFNDGRNRVMAAKLADKELRVKITKKEIKD